MNKKKQLKLPNSILGQLGDSINDKEWRESHNLNGKRKSRKELRREVRQAKKQKRSHKPEAEVAVKNTPKTQNQPKPKKVNKEPPKKSSSDVFLRPFVSKHDEELMKKDEEDAKYYAKKLGLKGLKLKDNEDDGLQDILGDLDFDDFEEKDKDASSNSDEEEELSADDFISDFEDDGIDASETMKKLAEVKKNKKGSSEMRIVKEDELSADDSLSDFDDDEDEEDEDGMSAAETMKKLAELKKNKKSGSSEMRIVKEDELSSDDSVSDFDNDDDSQDDDDDEDDGLSAAETMKKLAELKKNKKGTSEMRIVKEDELSADDSVSDFDDEEEDEEDDGLSASETMKKLAELKKNKGSSEMRIVKEDELSADDSVSDFDDFDEDEDDDGESDIDMSASETMKKLAALKKNKPSSEMRIVKEDELSADDSLSDNDDELSASDFESEPSDEESGEEMTAEETMKRLAALKAKKRASEKSGNELNSDDSDSYSSSEDENPYVPPTKHASVKRSTEDNEKSSEEVEKMRRAFKGALNKLTESNLTHISHDIQMGFLKNSRAEASEVFTTELLNLVNTAQPLQQVLYTVYAGVVATLYQSVGVAFAAHFVQTLIEHIMQPDGKLKNEAGNNLSNLTNLLAELYSFQIVGSRLLYDFLKQLLRDISSTESIQEVELLLIIIRSCGGQLRSDDPLALKEVIILLQHRMQDLGGTQALTPRMQFLIDSIVALKNNRQKPLSELVVSTRHRIKKALQSSGSRGSAGTLKEAMHVGLSDILESETRGKWWLVGASWKGNTPETSAEKPEEEKFNFSLDDEFGASSVDWLELAKKQRLNTDIRRAVFVALMGAEDYLDACLRIDKLGLKNKQEREVPHVILHCLLQEQAYNPYYMLVASKQCTRHSTMKTFQFRLWDWLNTEPSGETQHALHYGRFYANLVSQKAMPLDVLKQVDFLGGSSDTQLFLDMFFVTLYKDMAKIAEKDAKTSGHKRGLATIYSSLDKGSEQRDGRELALLLKKVQEAKVLRGIQIVNRRINKSEIIRTPKEKERVRWASQFVSDLIEELVKGA